MKKGLTIVAVTIMLFGIIGSSELFSQEARNCTSFKAENVKWSNNGKFLAIQGYTKILLVDEGLMFLNWIEIESNGEGLAWSPDDLYLISAIYNLDDFDDARLALINISLNKIEALLLGRIPTPYHTDIEWGANNMFAASSKGASDVIEEAIWTTNIWEQSADAVFYGSPSHLATYQIDPVFEKITDIAWHPSKNQLAQAVESGKITIWNIQDNTLSQSIDTKAFISAIAWHPDGTKIALINNREVGLWETTTGELSLFTSLKSNGTDLEWSSDGGYLAAGDVEGNLTIWNIEDAVIVYESHENSSILDLEWHPSDKAISVAYNDRLVCNWEILSPKSDG